MALSAQQLEKLFSFAALLLFLLFASCVVNHAFFFTMDADEAYNATTAKNWLNGYGYSSSIGVIFPFDPYISSGPAYTFLVAIPIKIFGNDPDVIKPFMALVHIGLLASCLLLIKSLLRSASKFFWMLLFCLGFFCVVEFKFWHRSAGELLSLLYFVNSIFVIELSWRKKSICMALLGGLLVAAAVLTKNQAWLFAIGLLAAMLFVSVHDVYKKQASCVLVFKLWAAFLVALLSPLLAWHCYENISLQHLANIDPSLYDYYLGKQWHFFSTHGSGLNMLWEVHSLAEFFKRESQLIALAFEKFSGVFSRFGMYKAWAATGLLLIVFLVLAVAFVGFFRAGRSAYLFLALPLSVFFLWAFFLNNSIFMHQMLPGVWLAIFAAGFVLARYPWILVVLAFVALSVMVGTRNKNGEYACIDGSNAACVYTQENPIRISFNNALAYLNNNNLPAPMANCGWYFSQDIEFSLPGVNNIQDCMRLLDDAVEFDAEAFVATNKLSGTVYANKTENDLKKMYVHKRKNLFGANFVAPIKWKKPVEFTYIANIYMMGNTLEQKRNVMSFLDHCKTVLHADQFYYIQHCKFEDIQSYVEEWHGLPIFTHSWEALYYRDFMQETKSQMPLSGFGGQ